MLNKNEIVISIFGDICPTDDYSELFHADPETLFHDVLNQIKGTDIAIANLECAITDSKIKSVKCGPSLRADAKCVKLLSSAGFHGLSLANNHIKDYGAAGVTDTIEAVRSSGMQAFGAGKTIAEAKACCTFEVKGKRIGFLSFAEHEFNLASENDAGANHFDPLVSLEDIREARKCHDYLFVLFHGGLEYYKYPSPQLQKKCRAMIQAGADAVFCQHSHCIGTEERYLGKTILYGQGNSVFGFRENFGSWNEGLLVQLTLGEQVTVSYRLLHAKKDGVYFSDPAEERFRLSEFSDDSDHLKDQEWISLAWKKKVSSMSSWYLPMFFGWHPKLNWLNRKLKGRLLRFVKRKRCFMVSMNMIRCETHREICTAALEDIAGFSSNSK